MQMQSTMPRPHSLRRGAAAIFSAVLSLSALSSAHAASFVRDGSAGFVVSDIKYALGGDTPGSDLCPDGMSLHIAEVFALSKEGKRRPGEADADYGQRVEEGGKALSRGANGEDYCLNPEVAPADTHFRTLPSNSATALGIDIDGGARPAACAQGEFAGPNGERGVDNQFYRLVGCSRSFQPEGQSNGFAIEMLSGAWGILFTLSGLDDLRNDDAVEVGFFANADPIQLSPIRTPLEYATYAIDQDPRFRAVARGRIKDGVLTTEPVDLRFHHVVNSMRVERVLSAARLQVTLSEQGTMSGYLAGYTPVESLYDNQFGYRHGKSGDGELAPLPLRSGTANGAARVLGYTCPGVYQAMHRLADGHPDPVTGQCTSISTQYRIEAIPAFVVDVATRSKNATLDKSREQRDDY